MSVRVHSYWGGSASGGEGPAGGREMLLADRMYYVSPNGDDDNEGRSAGTPFATVQRAIDVAASLDVSTHNVVIQLAAGTYEEAVVCRSFIGMGHIEIRGDLTTPGNVVISSATDCVSYDGVVGTYLVRGVRLTSATRYGLIANRGFGVLRFGDIEFGACSLAHILVTRNALVEAVGNYAISGPAANHVYGYLCGIFLCEGRTVTIVGAPSFTAFARAAQLAQLRFSSTTFSGAATGLRFDVSRNASIDVGGASTLYLPGNGNGTAFSGGQYG